MYCEVPWPLPEMTSILVMCITLVVAESLVSDGIPKDVNVFKKHISIELYSEADILSNKKKLIGEIWALESLNISSSESSEIIRSTR